MAITWLDDYAMMCKKVLKLQLHNGGVLTELEALLMCSGSNCHLKIANFNKIPQDELAFFHLNGAILKFIDKKNPGIGIKLSKDLVDIFLQATPPRNIHTIKDFIKDKNVYIDLPKNYLTINGRTTSAIFLTPLENTEDLMLCVVYSKNNESWNVFWTFGDSHYENQTNYVVEHIQNIERLTTLSLLYYISLTDKIKIPALPQRLPSRTKLTAIQNKLQNNNKSIFTIRSLEPPPDNFGRGAIIKRNGWKLEHKVIVRGHFRWQAYGEGWKEHKLIWIGEFERGKHLPHKPRLSIMPQTSPARAGHPTGRVLTPNTCEVVC